MNRSSRRQSFVLVFSIMSVWVFALALPVLALDVDEPDIEGVPEGEAPSVAPVEGNPQVAAPAPQTGAQRRRSADNAFLAATAFACPLNGITIDGSLDDWPKDAARYPILNNTQVYGLSRLDGADMADNPSLVAYFMVGYDVKSGQIYLAVVVKDDEHVVGQSYNSTDAVEIYVEGKNDKNRTTNAGGFSVLQYVGIAGKGTYGQGPRENPGIMQGEFATTGAKFAHKREGGTTVYEWALTAFDQFPTKHTAMMPMKRIGFDVVVVDKDGPHERIPEWVAWGPTAGGKYGNPGGIGELVLLPENAKLFTATGIVKDEEGKPAKNVLVWCESVEASKAPAAAVAPEKPLSAAESTMSAGVAQTDASGKFTIALPSGSYRFVVGRYQGFVTASSQLVTVKQEGENKPFEFTTRRVALPDVLQKSVEAYSRLKTYSDVTSLRVVDADADDGGANDATLRFDLQRPGTLTWAVKSQNQEMTLTVKDGKLKLKSGDAFMDSDADKALTPGSIAHRTGVAVPYPVSQLAQSVATGHRFAMAQDAEREIRRGLDGVTVIGPAKAEGRDCTIVELTKVAPTVAPLVTGWSLGNDVKLRLWVSNDGVVRRSEFRASTQAWAMEENRVKLRTMVYVASHKDVRVDEPAKAQESPAKPNP